MDFVMSPTIFTITEEKFSSVGGPHTCRWENCGESFWSLSQLGSHITHEHCPSRRTMPGVSVPYFCHWKGCQRRGKHFEARYKLLDHIRTHTNEKPFACSLCSKSFGRSENLKNHIRTHTGARPFLCPYDGCSKAYGNTSDRYKHMLTHRVQKPYCCKVPGCGKRYTDPSSLRKHSKTSAHGWPSDAGCWIEERENFVAFVLPPLEQIAPMDLSMKTSQWRSGCCFAC